MAIRVLIVDDSSFFCTQLVKMLEIDSDFEVVGVANNGREAITKAQQLRPDVITMDVEMPVMDGITATREIMAKCPTRILMLSSLTYEGARLTLAALESGAIDFHLKSYEELSDIRGRNAARLRAKVRAVSRARLPTEKNVQAPSTTTQTPQRPTAPKGVSALREASSEPKTKPVSPPRDAVSAVVLPKDISIIVIGASTGGPVAVQKLITELPGTLRVPMLVVQHMPSSFTGAFASRLNKISSLTVVEAKNQMRLASGHVYIAPGGYQCYLTDGSTPTFRIAPPDNRVPYQPCVDITFASVAKHFGRKSLAIVLTGMGSDGRDGARLLKEKGGVVWAQDEQSCVVYGMPKAVVSSGLADNQLTVESMAQTIRRVLA
ncbi:MAG: chemotaxis response regulator protein-glutamate methylesterase [Gammaproteobacteria bacterium]|nr:MAG: chemotaxis response regulator protein-glutamate methylesterase [Gammaproteobacteria bacterium]